MSRARELSAPLFLPMPTQEMRVKLFEAFRCGTGGSFYHNGEVKPELPAFYRINS